MQQIVDITGDLGQKFLENLRKEYPVKKLSEKTKEVYLVTGEKLGFLNDIVTEKGVEIEKVEIGHYGRKTGWTSQREENNENVRNFRLVIHFGNPEAYYYNDHVHAVMDGYGFILSHFAPSEVSVSNNPIQVFNHQGIQSVVPKIRPRQYIRTTIVYYLKMSLDKIENESTDQEENTKE